MSTIDRRELLARAGIVTAGATVAIAAGRATVDAAPPGSHPAEGQVALVTGTTSQAGVVEAEIESSGAALRVHNAWATRQLRAGDRVVVTTDPESGASTALPLFMSLTGRVERLRADSFVVQGRKCLIDAVSVCFQTDKHEVVHLGRLRGNRKLIEGASVGVLCMDNRSDHTLTVDTLYLFK